jgi:hypothetical protein
MRPIAAVAGLAGCITIVDGDSPYKFTDVTLTSSDLTEVFSDRELQLGKMVHTVDGSACSDADVLKVDVTDGGESALFFHLVFPAGQHHTAMPSGPGAQEWIPLRVTSGDRERYWTGGEVEWTPHLPDAVVVHFRDYWSCDPRDRVLGEEVDLDRCEPADLATLVLIGVKETTEDNDYTRPDGWVDADGRPLCGWGP